MNDTILSLKEIQEGLQDKRLYTVARSTGLSYPTLRKLAEGKAKNPTIETLKAVSNYLLNPKR